MQQNVAVMMNQISLPYESLLKKSKELESIHVAELCLVKVRRYNQLMLKLNGALRKKDLTKAASYIQDIELIMKDEDPEISKVFLFKSRPNP